MHAPYALAFAMLAIGSLIVLVALFNLRHQRAFMARANENTEKLAQQRAATQDLIARQTAALERIAEALERGKT